MMERKRQKKLLKRKKESLTVKMTAESGSQAGEKVEEVLELEVDKGEEIKKAAGGSGG